MKKVAICIPKRADNSLFFSHFHAKWDTYEKTYYLYHAKHEKSGYKLTLFGNISHFPKFREYNAREPGSQGAREPGSRGAGEPGSRGAGEPGSRGVREPGSPGNQAKKVLFGFAIRRDTKDKIIFYMTGE